jgi:peptidoglycan/LPS O-acetylase OafA/YrhL
MGWLRAYGKYSYSIYIFHAMLFNFVDTAFLRLAYQSFHTSRFRGWFHQQGPASLAILATFFVVNLVGACLIMLALGKLSWWAFEGPINRLKTRFPVCRTASVPSVKGFRRSYSRG